MPTGRPHSVAVRRRFWEQIRAGFWPRDAAAVVGVSHQMAKQWYRQAGGVMPPVKVPGKQRPRLRFEQREEIAILLAQGVHHAEIARQIGCHRSTIGREIALNSTRPTDGHRPRYRASSAHKRSSWRAPRAGCQPSKLASSKRLRRVVSAQLKEEFSPEQISERLKIDYPEDDSMRISHEAIYQALYVQGRGALARDLHKRLRTGRALRKTRRVSGVRQQRIIGMVNISERPPQVEDRAVPGHWEGDLITGKENKTAIGTLVERATGFVMLLHLPDDHGADALQQAMVQKMAQLPATLRQTLTWDQGIEMANHVQIAAATDLDIYFCDPHSPWQRGSNENTNGLLRQYFPKGADLSLFAPDYLDHVAAKLNHRPRKRLAWRTPAEALDKLLSEPFDPSVASTG
jgi:IS30 family transposase